MSTTPHPVDNMKTADGVPVLSLRPPIYSVNLMYTDPPREHTAFSVSLVSGHAHITYDGGSRRMEDTYQSKAKAMLAHAEAMQKRASDAFRKAAEIGGGA